MNRALAKPTSEPHASRRASGSRCGGLAGLPCLLVFRLTPQGGVLWANDAVEHLLGIPAGKAVGRRLADLLFPHAPRRAESFQSLWASGIPAEPRELTTTAANGARVQLELTFASLPLEPSGAPTILGLALDLTARRSPQDRFPPEPFLPYFRVTGDGEVLDANAAGLEVLGQAGTLPAPLLAPLGEVIETQERMLVEAVAGGRVYLFTLSPTDGQQVELFGQDITTWRRTKEESEQFEPQLRQAQKMEAIGRLAGGVAHDFNNLLSVILSCTRFLADSLAADSPFRAEVDDIHKAATDAAGLTQQLLAFSRKREVEPTPIDLNVVIADMCKMLRRIVGEDIDLRIRLDSDLGIAVIDRGIVQQVIANLVVNARDALPDGGTIDISTANVDLDATEAGSQGRLKPGGYVAFTVRDSGIGMSPDTVSRLYEPFFTTKSPGMGTGFGLATVYGVVKQAGGFLALHTEVGGGTSFTVMLPRAAFGPSASPASDSQPTPQPGSGERILIVEDAPAVANALGRILQSNGYRIVQAGSPRQALELFTERGDEIDLVVSDVVMPEMSGRALVERLRSRRPNLRVIFVSGHSDDAISRHGALENCVFLRKPFTVESLLDTVSRAFKA
ncbi:MAG TPA: hypothetical protein DFS52_19925 [Myxococcales bacterium]|jgi:signal transduction histidine kinase/CheY-like chemotaxis protein|nr:hypothetical protein [Myxococcales bacterium]